MLGASCARRQRVAHFRSEFLTSVVGSEFRTTWESSSLRQRFLTSAANCGRQQRVKIYRKSSGALKDSLENFRWLWRTPSENFRQIWGGENKSGRSFRFMPHFWAEFRRVKNHYLQYRWHICSTLFIKVRNLFLNYGHSQKLITVKSKKLIPWCP